MNSTIPVAVLLTTARFIQEGPGPIGPLKPAVPNCKNPEKQRSNSLELPSFNQSLNCLAVSLSGSLSIHS